MINRNPDLLKLISKTKQLLADVPMNSPEFIDAALGLIDEFIELEAMLTEQDHNISRQDFIDAQACNTTALDLIEKIIDHNSDFQHTIAYSLARIKLHTNFCYLSIRIENGINESNLKPIKEHLFEACSPLYNYKTIYQYINLHNYPTFIAALQGFTHLIDELYDVDPETGIRYFEVILDILRKVFELEFPEQIHKLNLAEYEQLTNKIFNLYLKISNNTFNMKLFDHVKEAHKLLSDPYVLSFFVTKEKQNIQGWYNYFYKSARYFFNNNQQQMSLECVNYFTQILTNILELAKSTPISTFTAKDEKSISRMLLISTYYASLVQQTVNNKATRDTEILDVKARLNEIFNTNEKTTNTINQLLVNADFNAKMSACIELDKNPNQYKKCMFELADLLIKIANASAPSPANPDCANTYYEMAIKIYDDIINRNYPLVSAYKQPLNLESMINPHLSITTVDLVEAALKKVNVYKSQLRLLIAQLKDPNLEINLDVFNNTLKIDDAFVIVSHDQIERFVHPNLLAYHTQELTDIYNELFTLLDKVEQKLDKSCSTHFHQTTILPLISNITIEEISNITEKDLPLDEKKRQLFTLFKLPKEVPNTNISNTPTAPSLNKSF